METNHITVSIVDKSWIDICFSRHRFRETRNHLADFRPIQANFFNIMCYSSNFLNFLFTHFKCAAFHLVYYSNFFRWICIFYVLLKHSNKFVHHVSIALFYPTSGNVTKSHLSKKKPMFGQCGKKSNKICLKYSPLPFSQLKFDCKVT